MEMNSFLFDPYTSEDLNPHTKRVLGFNSLLASDITLVRIINISYIYIYERRF